MDKLKLSEEELISTIVASSTCEHFFYVEKTTNSAFCKNCLRKFAYQQSTGTSSLKRHLDRNNPQLSNAKKKNFNFVLNQSTLSYFHFRSSSATSTISKLPTTTKCIMTLCCAKHVLPLNFFEDPIINEGLNIPRISQRAVKNEIEKLDTELKLQLFEENRGKFAAIALDGWKNTVTDEKHLSIIMFFCDKPDRPIFLRTFILDEASASNICSHVIIALDELAKYEISIVASITDNARNMVAAMRQLSEVHPNILPLRCAAHVLNLIINDALSTVEFLKSSLLLLQKYIVERKVSRYCETRWNSIFDLLVDLLKYIHQNESSKLENIEMITNAIEALTPLIQVLTLAQKDGTSWRQLYHAVMDAILKVKQSGRDSIVSVVEKRLDLLLNPFVHLFLF